MQRTPSSNKSQQQQQLQRRNTSFEIMSRRKQGMMILCILIGTAYGFGGGGSGGSLFHHSLTAGVRTTSSTTTVDVIASLKGSSTKSVNLAGGRFTFGNLVGASTSSLQLSSSNSNENSSNESLELIQRWLLLHLPSLSDDDLQMYSMQLLEDGFDTVEKLEGVNNKMSRGSNNNNHRLEDLYFMKKGHRRVLLQKIGKIREMKGNVKNRLRLFEEEEEVGGDGKVNQQKDEVGGDEVKKVVVVVDENKMESGEKEPRGSEEVQDISTAAAAGGLSMQSSSNNNNDDDSLISLTAWENKQLEEFVYSEQERDAMDDKSKRRLKEIEAYLKEHRSRHEES